MRLFTLALVLATGVASSASAETRSLTLPLHDGRVHIRELAELLAREVGGSRLAEWAPNRAVNVRGWAGSLVVTSLDEALGEGFDVSVDADQLVVLVDTAELPQDSLEARKALRVFTAGVEPEATERLQARYGLSLPADLDEGRPLVLLVHGLNSHAGRWSDMAELLAAEGYQVAYFSYANDQPISESANQLADAFVRLREQKPNLEVDVIAHSMGGIIARTWIEGVHYSGGVDRFIMLAPPNQGSSMYTVAIATELEEHWRLRRDEADWHWSWCFTDGCGEACDELAPDSDFLQALNSRGRREGVRYTIVGGNRHTGWRLAGEAATRFSDWIPEGRVIGRLRQRSEQVARRITDHNAESDGAVELDRIHLAGVADLIVVPADHTTIYRSEGDEPPVAWPTIRDRLAK